MFGRQLCCHWVSFIEFLLNQDLRAFQTFCLNFVRTVGQVVMHHLELENQSTSLQAFHQTRYCLHSWTSWIKVLFQLQVYVALIHGEKNHVLLWLFWPCWCGQLLNFQHAVSFEFQPLVLLSWSSGTSPCARVGWLILGVAGWTVEDEIMETGI